MIWFPRLLFLLSVTLALVLAAAVMVSPWFDAEQVPPGWSRLVAVFADDTVVRRTSLASAAGLVVTACVFFRPHLFRSGSKKSGKHPPPGSFAGA